MRGSLLLLIATLFVSCTVAKEYVSRNTLGVPDQEEDSGITGYETVRSLSTGQFFSPLECNSNLPSSCTLPLSSLIVPGQPTVVECGSCAFMDRQLSTDVFLSGLNIVGKLVIDETQMEKIKIHTPYIFVQGELQIKSSGMNKVSPSNRFVTFLLTGGNDLMFTPHAENAGACPNGSCSVGKRPFVVAGGKLSILALHPLCPTWKSLKLVQKASGNYRDLQYWKPGGLVTSSNPIPYSFDHYFQRRQGNSLVQGLVVDSDIAICWGEGSEVLVTSHTLNSEDGQVLTIESVTDNSDGTALVRFTTDFVAATSEQDTHDFAVEIALLTRNVLIEGAEGDGTNEEGGYVSIYRTSNVQQIVEGVELRYMGQKGIVDRFPLHLKMCGGINGTKISKNTIRDSYQRGIVLQGTQGVLLSENIAYNNPGHTYMLQDGAEYENTFQRNLGAGTHKLSQRIPDDWHYDSESPSTFFCFNPNNIWIENVAAGSTHSGFRFHLQNGVKGESAHTYSLIPRREGVAWFIGNVGHSNYYYGVHVEYLESTQMCSFENGRFYLNKEGGGLFYRSRNIEVIGGIYADNRIQLSFDQTDEFALTGASIIGVTSTQKNVSSMYPGLDPLCPSENPIVGIKIPTYLRYNTYRGGFLSDLTFFGFDSTGCTGSVPITFDTARRDKHWDYTTSSQNVTINDANSRAIDVCAAHSRGVTNVLITDIDSSLNPDKNSAFDGASSIVSLKPFMTGFREERCVDYTAHCFSYCENTCLRTVSFFTEAFGSEDLLLHVADISNETKHIEVRGNHQSSKNPFFFSYIGRPRRFAVSLPGGSTYTADFRDTSGTTIWPVYVEEFWEHQPACFGHANPGDIQLQAPVQPICESYVRNSNMDTDTIPWLHNGGGINFLPGMGINGSNAIGSIDRKNPEHGIGQYLDTRCLKANVNKDHLITAWVKVVFPNKTAVNCGQENSSLVTCPTISYIVKYYEDTKVKQLLQERKILIEEAEVNSQHERNDFKKIQGIFGWNEKVHNVESLFLYIAGVDDDYEVIIDSLSVELSQAPIPSPTQSLSSMPSTELMQSLYQCPQIGETYTLVEPGPVSFMISKKGELCTLTKVHIDQESNEVSSVVPVARSYDGFVWEKAAGEFATYELAGNDWSCFEENTCVISLPYVDNANEKYVLTSFNRSISSDGKVARFLESTTFGTTRSAMGGLTGSGESMVDWVRNQIYDVTLTSHREFWRRRANPRMEFAQQVGKPNHPCSALSRWRKYTFTRKDASKDERTKYLEAVSVNGDGSPYKLVVDGHVRTIVSEIVFKDASYSFNYAWSHEICNYPSPPSEKLSRGRLFLRNENGKCLEVDREIGNPAVDFTGLEEFATYVFHLDTTDLTPVSEYVGTYPVKQGEDLMLIHELDDVLCASVPAGVLEGEQPIFGLLGDGTWLQHDPRLVLVDNEPRKPIPDGGGSTMVSSSGATLCSNAPRTFLNIHDCVLSKEISSCSSGKASAPESKVLLDDENIIVLHELTRRYVYAVTGLPVRDSFDNTISHPCSADHMSRWEKSPNTHCSNRTALHDQTLYELTKLLEESNDQNQYINDIVFPKNDASCHPSDTDPEIQIQIGNDCWTHVHPEHLSVFDVTYWTKEDTHPGNAAAEINGNPHPIKKWADIDGSAKLVFPAKHPVDVSLDHSVDRWNSFYEKFKKIGRYGDTVLFRDLPDILQKEEVATHFVDAGDVAGEGVLICGSPGEIGNDPNFDSIFDVTSISTRDTSSPGVFRSQREVVWTTIALTAEDQLRQRMAWALSQILAIAKTSISSQDRNTEIFLNYYDIFVRHAFGNYGDILREISYSPIMAENLSFIQSKSSAYVWEKDRMITFADENFSREIMQLFSVGLIKLNMDGSPKFDSKGNTIQVYNNDHIMSFARAWTGFDRQERRGNMEDYEDDDANRLDPMAIQPDWRDRYPKVNLNGGYIGDGYPLCEDLPTRMFLREGATYRLLGKSNHPELMVDDVRFRNESSTARFALSETSELRQELSCSVDSNGVCRYRNQITLTSNLICAALECQVDTVRVVEVYTNIFYEYVQPPCVQMAFFRNPMKIMRRNSALPGSMCGNPSMPVASEACCTTNPDDHKIAERNYLYEGERMTFHMAQYRCNGMVPPREPCDYTEIDEEKYDDYQTGYHWALEQCTIMVKVDDKGYVAIVHETDHFAPAIHVGADNRNYFLVLWDSNAYPQPDNDETSCGEGNFLLADGSCLCRITVVENSVYDDSNMPQSREEVLSLLHIGALQARTYAVYNSTLLSNIDVIVHKIDNTVDMNTIFEVTDDMGRKHFRKNVNSIVELVGSGGQKTNYSFRNTPQFMSLIPTETDARNAIYETESVLDDYFYHENTAPFLAIRFIQRFGVSNPSPRYIRTVAQAFRYGSYDSNGHVFGEGKYGDLAATAAAVALDREARTPVLDADPSHGCLREPIIKVLAFLRNMDLNILPDYPMVELFDMEKVVGQMAHESPSVFSFFLSEYVPDGPIAVAGLVAPEAMTYGTPKIVGLLNGFFSLVKYGLSRCHGGFGKNDASGKCNDDGLYESARGVLHFQPSMGNSKDIIDELATLLTSDRLSSSNREIIQGAYDKHALTDEEGAVRLAQQLMVTTPEFHSTNLVQKNDRARESPKSESSNSSLPYKATVFLMLAGGCDSYNLIVPASCPDSTILEQYLEIRQQVAITAGTHEISASNQVCEKFGVHPSLPVLKDLYNENSALFIANTGVITRRITKDNYTDGAPKSELFAHNTMQRETRRVDPNSEFRGTGVMGRIRDVLTRNGVKTGAISIETNTDALVGQPGISAPYSILGENGVDEFNPEPSDPNMLSRIADLNNATYANSGFCAETWSAKLLTSLEQNEQLYEALTTVTTTTQFPDTELGNKLKLVTQMMQTHTNTGNARDLFFVEFGGFDAHSKVLDNLIDRFSQLNDALIAFVIELKHLKLWDNMVLLQTSDFGRTLTPNAGDGTDHAWGGNYFMLGGPVKGGRVKGTYPEDITESSALRLKRGRLCPTTAWEMVWNGLAQWIGIDSEDDLAEICPNRKNFPSEELFDADDLFENGTGARTLHLRK